MKSAGHRLSKHVSESSEHVYEEIDALKTSLRDLRGDITELVSHALGLGRGGAYVARDTASDAVDQLKSRLAGLRSRGGDQMAAIEKRIEERPVSAALLAFGAGFLAALLLSRR